MAVDRAGYRSEAKRGASSESLFLAQEIKLSDEDTAVPGGDAGLTPGIDGGNETPTYPRGLAFCRTNIPIKTRPVPIRPRLAGSGTTTPVVPLASEIGPPLYKVLLWKKS